jgi:hypothetical protein
MTVLALPLFALGVILLTVAGRGLWPTRPYDPACDMPCPDGDGCSGTMAHVGWHHRNGAQWWGQVWRPPTNTLPAKVRHNTPSAVQSVQLTLQLAAAAAHMVLLALVMVLGAMVAWALI